MPPWHHTHTITLDGGSRIRVCVPNDGESPAYTSDEWAAGATADYSRDGEGRWLFQGKAFSGSVQRAKATGGAHEARKETTMNPSDTIKTNRDGLEAAKPTEPQHTPGPWTAYSNSVVMSARGHNIADTRIGMTSLSDNESDANARLIAAAPDMLDALRQAEEALGCNLQWLCDATLGMLAKHRPEAPGRIKALEEAWRSIVLAHAKATGGAL